jgi:nonsense-mediated mRNA decay protein 3
VCGISIEPNPSNTCANCLATTSDVTKGISTEATMHQCRGCQRWHHSEGKWVGCELESRELMSLCLGKINSGIKKQPNVKLVDASWVWTEPHSMRLKVRLTIQKEVQLGTILQQAFVVTYVVRNQQCVECQAEFRTGSWKSLVQVRQRVRHKRTFLFLEQLILKHGAHRGCLNIETLRDGMDFYFPDKGKAARFISFLESVVPIKVKTSKKLIGTDVKSNIANFKYTNLVEIVPLCKDDLLYLPSKLARNMGNINRLVLVKNVSNLIHLVDPLTGQTASMSGDVYWRDPIRPIITFARSRLTRFVILGKEAVMIERNVSKRSTVRQRNRIATLTLANEEDLGVNDNQVEENSHIGYLMKAGDVCLGYELKDAQLVEDDAEQARNEGRLPDAIIVRKLYGGVATNEVESAKKRIFALQRLDVDVVEALNPRVAKKDKENDDMDEEDFLREVEADKEMRSRMNLYKSEYITRKLQREEEIKTEQIDDESMDDQEVQLEELLDGLILDEGPDNQEDVNGMDMVEDENGGIFYEEGERAAKDGIGFIQQDDARNIQTKEAAVPVGNTFGKEFMDKKFNFL